jgi:hypothetical protein
VILPEPTHDRSIGRSVDLDDNAATLLKWELDQSLHPIPPGPEHLSSAR